MRSKSMLIQFRKLFKVNGVTIPTRVASTEIGDNDARMEI
jgi:hypothetical protein